jgi:hypothetical protein
MLRPLLFASFACVVCRVLQVRDHPLVHKLEVDKPITEPHDEWKKALYRSQWPGLAKDLWMPRPIPGVPQIRKGPPDGPYGGGRTLHSGGSVQYSHKGSQALLRACSKHGGGGGGGLERLAKLQDPSKATLHELMAPMHEPPQPPTCSVCGKFPRPGEKIKRCSACKSVLYCGRECQEADWKAGHKDKCKGMQMERERAAALAANPLPPPAAAPLKQVKGRGGKWRVKRELTPQTRDLYPGMPAAPPAPAPAPAKPLSNDDFRKILQGGGDGPAVKRRRY